MSTKKKITKKKVIKKKAPDVEVEQEIVELIETVTLSMFKSWLEGVEEMQGDDWTPTSTQWKRIREKIDTIENEPGTHQVATPNKVVTQRPRVSAPVPTFLPQSNDVLPVFPEVPSGIPSSAANVMQTGNGSIPLQPVNPMLREPQPGQANKTPDIDTSTGQYESSFK